MRQSPLRVQVNTYSRWLPAFYVLLVLAPLHVMVNVAVFAAFLRIMYGAVRHDQWRRR